MTHDEKLWINIRFYLFLLFFVVSIFAVLCRYIEIPDEDSDDLIGEINYSETVFRLQHTYAEKASKLWEDIDSLDFNTHQVQHMDEVKDEIGQLSEVYKENHFNTKFFFGVLSSRALKLKFDAMEELNTTIRNNEFIERDLEECKANL